MGSIPVSVIIPAYNSQDTLVKTVESLINGEQHMVAKEIIIVDDSSLDDTPYIIHKLCKKYPEVIGMKTDKNVGPADARHLGVMHSKNNFISFIDSDDYISKGAIGLAYNKLNATKSDFCLWNIIRVKKNNVLELIHNLKDHMFPLLGLEAAKMTIGFWDIPTIGVFKKNNYFQSYETIDLPYFRKDELVMRETMRLSNKVTRCSGIYYYQLNDISLSSSNTNNDYRRLLYNSWLIDWAISNMLFDDNELQLRAIVNKSLSIGLHVLLGELRNQHKHEKERSQVRLSFSKIQNSLFNLIAQKGFYGFKVRQIFKCVLFLFGLILIKIYSKVGAENK
jgi:glycosyltransferase involved in cell wall biosynthesis